LGFPGREVQSVFGFLKGKIQIFSPIFAVCVDTAMSRQDNFFFFLVKVCSILGYSVLFCWYEVITEFFFYTCSYCVFLYFEYCLSSGGIFFFFVLFVGGASCVFIYLLHLYLVCIFWGV
jgi:hypothetical protein